MCKYNYRIITNYITHDFVPFGSMDITEFLADRKPLFMKSRRRKLSRLNQKESGKLHLKKRVHSQLEENVLFRKLIAHHNFFTRTHFKTSGFEQFQNILAKIEFSRG